MANNTFVSLKRKALLAHKEKLLEELKYYEKRVQDEQSKTTVEYYFDDDSSESDDDLGITTDFGPSIMQLKLEQSKLRTCLQATQELTNLQILQSEVSVIVNDPVLNRESPVKEPGTWREVTAECRIDLIPFSLTFYVHKSNAKFGAKSYRGLQVMIVKAAHEAELSKSVLPTLVRPSDAIEVLRSYADAYRSRRSTLARLATKYADSLYMEPMAEGGYLLKCANLLQVAWRLENKWSPLAPFHHRMKFDLEYMEEKYINTITQSHKQLSDPTISTDERTLLLSKIIATCLEAKPMSESADSDQDARMPKRRATLDQEIEEPELKKKKEVMAPPKSLPKKSKASKIMSDKSRPSDSNNKKSVNESNRNVDKENLDNNLTKTNLANSNAGIEKSVVSGSKVQKTGDKALKKVTSSRNVVESTKSKETENIADMEAKNKPKKAKTTPQNKNPETQTDNVEKPQSGKKNKDKNSKKVVSSNENNANAGVNKDSNLVPAKKNKVNDEQGVTMNKKKSKEAAVDKNDVDNDNKTSKTNKGNSEVGSKTKTANVDGKKTNVDTEASATNKKPRKETNDVNNVPKKPQTNEAKEKTVTKQANKVQNSATTNKVVEKNVASNKIKDNIVDIAKKTSSSKTVSNPKGNKNENIKNKDGVNKKTTEPNIESNKAKTVGEKKVTDKKGKDDKNKDSAINSDAINVLKNTDKERNEKLNKNKTSQGNVKNIDHAKKSVLPLRMQNNMKMIRKSIGSINTKQSNIAKENVGSKSKIPQKKLSPLNEKIFKKNPLRMSPRHMASTFNSTSSLGSKYSAQKPTTNIPRLAKPMFKAK